MLKFTQGFTRAIICMNMFCEKFNLQACVMLVIFPVQVLQLKHELNTTAEQSLYNYPHDWMKMSVK